MLIIFPLCCAAKNACANLSGLQFTFILPFLELPLSLLSEQSVVTSVLLHFLQESLKLITCAGLIYISKFN